MSKKWGSYIKINQKQASFYTEQLCDLVMKISANSKLSTDDIISLIIFATKEKIIAERGIEWANAEYRPLLTNAIYHGETIPRWMYFMILNDVLLFVNAKDLN